MKEKQADPEKIIVIDIKLTRGLVVVLSCVLVGVALLAYLTLTGERAAASEAETTQAASTGTRQFYLTEDGYPGNAAKTACAGGYHMASLWELADPSNLRYNTTLGVTSDDSGQGPPTPTGDTGTGAGWVRTGYQSDDSTTFGHANCLLWNDASVNKYGSVAFLPPDWTGGDQDVGVWATYVQTCFAEMSVWCIED